MIMISFYHLYLLGFFRCQNTKSTLENCFHLQAIDPFLSLDLRVEKN